MDEHRKIDTISVLANKGVILFFEDGSHTYIDPENSEKIVKAILSIDTTFED